MERDKEIEQYLPLVNRVLKKSFNTYSEDLFQIGCIGLIKGVDTYNPNKNASKMTYYWKCIYNQIAMSFRKPLYKTADLVSLNAYSNLDGEKESEYLDLLTDNKTLYDDLQEKENKDKIYKALDLLSKTEKIIILYTFDYFETEKINQRELSMLLNLSQPQISKLKRKALLKMRRYLERNHYEGNYNRL